MLPLNDRVIFYVCLFLVSFFIVAYAKENAVNQLEKYQIYIKINDNCATSNSPILADRYFIRIEETEAIKAKYNSNFVISSNEKRTIIDAPLSELYLQGAKSENGVWLFTLMQNYQQQESEHDHSENDKGGFRLGALRLHPGESPDDKVLNKSNSVIFTDNKAESFSLVLEENSMPKGDEVRLYCKMNKKDKDIIFNCSCLFNTSNQEGDIINSP